MAKGKEAIIQSMRYRWSLFKSPEDFDLSKAVKSASFDAPNVPNAVVDSFRAEKIVDLSGEYGDPSVGDPVEVDFFQAQTSEGEIRIHVFNRGASMFMGDDPRLVRLHRFFCVLQKFQCVLEQRNAFKGRI